MARVGFSFDYVSSFPHSYFMYYRTQWVRVDRFGANWVTTRKILRELEKYSGGGVRDP